MKLHFLGANRQVTGSRYLLETGDLRIMIDCGMFQERQFLDRNWEASPVPPESIDVMLLTHAHLDHCGLLPRVAANGFRGRVITTEPTVRLAQIVMLDSARIQEEDVKYKEKRHRKQGRKSPHPYVPLYTVEHAEAVAGQFQGVQYEQPVKLNDHVTATFHEAGHILGAACITLTVREDGQPHTLLFSGDIGQWNKPLIGDPSTFEAADFVIMESTYGDRNHPDISGDIESQLADVIHETVERGGNVIIPTFAIERAQELVYHIGRLTHAQRIPAMTIYLDSPMAVDVTEVFRDHRDWMDAETRAMFDAGRAPLHFEGLRLVRTVEESKAINAARGSSIIMAGSGMCTGGRVKHHLVQNITRQDSTILFVGFQAIGTLGRQIVDGREEVRIHGRKWPVLARVAQIHGFSAHADRDDLLHWLGHLQSPPKQLFLTHGEESAATKLADTVRQSLGWEVSVPAYQSVVEL